MVRLVKLIVHLGKVNERLGRIIICQEEVTLRLGKITYLWENL